MVVEAVKPPSRAGSSPPVLSLEEPRPHDGGGGVRHGPGEEHRNCDHGAQHLAQPSHEEGNPGPDEHGQPDGGHHEQQRLFTSTSKNWLLANRAVKLLKPFQTV